MNLFAIAGPRARPEVFALALDPEAQDALTTMFAGLVPSAEAG